MRYILYKMAKVRQFVKKSILLIPRGIGGIMVSLAAIQAVDPGSIPCHRINFLKILFMK